MLRSVRMNGGIIFGHIKDAMMGLSVPGYMAWHYWRQIPHHQESVVLDEFVVMPDHVHGIIGIESQVANLNKKDVGTLHATSVRNDNLAQDKMSSISPKAGSLSAIIRSYKSAVTRWCNAHEHEYFAWQSRFYDHIIRNEHALKRIRQYIFDNPLQWQKDKRDRNADSNIIHEQVVEYMIGA